MNVKDTQSIDIAPDQYLQKIFERQAELMEKYVDIEVKKGTGKGLIAELIWSIDDHKCQYVCKDFAWRITEELAEAGEALAESSEKEIDLTHAREEVIDALHFLVELCILNGYDSLFMTKLPPKIEADSKFRSQLTTDYKDNPLKDLFERAIIEPFCNFSTVAWKLVETLGKAMNCLKNKPWKQTQMRTDALKFKNLIGATFLCWIRCAKIIGLDADTSFDLYYRKSEVNKFRQRSNY